MKRRTVVITGPLLAVGAWAGFTRTATTQGAEDLEPLTDANRAARALHYVDDAANADLQHYEQGSGEKCDNCRHYRGGDQARGGCDLFPGYSVPASAWCAGWVGEQA